MDGAGVADGDGSTELVPPSRPPVALAPAAPPDSDAVGGSEDFFEPQAPPTLDRAHSNSATPLLDNIRVTS
jgi:hypothetical protein